VAGEIGDIDTIVLDIPLTKDYGGGTYRVL